MSLTANCHCGGTRIVVAAEPGDVTDCNCTFCFKRGALWAYFAPDQVAVVDDAHAVGYTSDPELYMHHHCGVCGCSTYSRTACTWTEEGADFGRPRIAVNARLFEGLDLAALPVTRLDGRNQW